MYGVPCGSFSFALLCLAKCTVFIPSEPGARTVAACSTRPCLPVVPWAAANIRGDWKKTYHQFKIANCWSTLYRKNEHGCIHLTSAQLIHSETSLKSQPLRLPMLLDYKMSRVGIYTPVLFNAAYSIFSFSC